MDRDEMSNLYRESSIDASFQVSVHLEKRFQRRITLQHDNVNFDKMCCNLFDVSVNKTVFVMAERELVVLHK
jgi:hypothetical protein